MNKQGGGMDLIVCPSQCISFYDATFVKLTKQQFHSLQRASSIFRLDAIGPLEESQRNLLNGKCPIWAVFCPARSSPAWK